MKAKKYTMLTALAALLTSCLIAPLTTSCKDGGDTINLDDGLIWDTSPLVISVKVVSPEGYSVLNDQTVKKITATYHDQTYACLKTTRYYMPTFYGLTYVNDYLLFGELDGANTYHGEQLIIDWGDGSKQDTITFTHRPIWENEELSFQQEFRLNGKVTTGQIVIYKDFSAEADNTPRRDIPLSAFQQQLVHRINNFGFNLFREMYDHQAKPNTSCVASPLSVSYILGMLATGARFDFQEEDGTRAEILKALDMRNVWQYDYIDPMNELFKTLIDYAPLVDTSVELQLANAFFTRNEFTIYGGYPSFLAQYYHADYERLDFASPSALEQINGWCNQKTKGLIPTILDEISPQAVAFFLNAIYFRAGWSMAFDEAQTQEGDFTQADGNTTKLPLMHNRLTTSYAKTDLFEALFLPFSKQAYRMYVLLPTNGHTIADVVEALSDQIIMNIPWFTADANVTLPRFQISSDYDELSKMLQTLGIRRMFTPKAEFTEISPDPIYVSLMKQKASLTINEQGGEAAVITIAGMYDSVELDDPPSPLPVVTFTADRPFVFLITEQSSSTIFFVGTYGGE